MTLLVACLIDTDAHKVIETIAGSFIQIVIDTLTDRADTFPVDTHEFGYSRPAGMHTKPGDLLPKAWVNQEPCRAQGTDATTTPCFAHRIRGALASR